MLEEILEMIILYLQKWIFRQSRLSARTTARTRCQGPPIPDPVFFPFYNHDKLKKEKRLYPSITSTSLNFSLATHDITSFCEWVYLGGGSLGYLHLHIIQHF